MVKRILGFFLFIIGLFLENIGIYGLAYTSGKKLRIDNQLQEELALKSMTDYEQELTIGGSLVVIGLVLIIVGISLIVSKTKKQREIEIELKMLKSMSKNEYFK